MLYSAKANPTSEQAVFAAIPYFIPFLRLSSSSENCKKPILRFEIMIDMTWEFIMQKKVKVRKTLTAVKHCWSPARNAVFPRNFQRYFSASFACKFHLEEFSCGCGGFESEFFSFFSSRYTEFAEMPITTPVCCLCVFSGRADRRVVVFDSITTVL